MRQGPLAWAHGLAGIGGYHALYFAALGAAPAVEANLLNYSWPLLIVLLSGLIGGLRLGAQRWRGVAMGAAGAALLLAGDATFPAEAWLGFACAIAAAFVWALYSVLAARLGSVPSEAVAGFCLASGILAGLAHLALEPPAALDARQWLVVALLGPRADRRRLFPLGSWHEARRPAAARHPRLRRAGRLHPAARRHRRRRAVGADARSRRRW